MTRTETQAGMLYVLGAEPAVVDVFDAVTLSRVHGSVRPDVVIDQLTDLPKDLNPDEMGAAIGRIARVRDEGSRNLVKAALASGARRLISQSIAWAYAPGLEPHTESDPLGSAAEGMRGITVRGVIALECLTLKPPPLAGIVLRHCQLHGPGTHSEQLSSAAGVHVDAAACAALFAIGGGALRPYHALTGRLPKLACGTPRFSDRCE